jgi:hypothetical protein
MTNIDDKVINDTAIDQAWDRTRASSRYLTPPRCTPRHAHQACAAPRCAALRAAGFYLRRSTSLNPSQPGATGRAGILAGIRCRVRALAPPSSAGRFAVSSLARRSLAGSRRFRYRPQGSDLAGGGPRPHTTFPFVWHRHYWTYLRLPAGSGMAVLAI